MHELVIRNARICDGSGGPIYDGALAVDDGRISVVGHVSARGKEDLNAQVMVLAPGIINLHTHFDALS